MWLLSCHGNGVRAIYMAERGEIFLSGSSRNLQAHDLLLWQMLLVPALLWTCWANHNRLFNTGCVLDEDCNKERCWGIFLNIQGGCSWCVTFYWSCCNRLHSMALLKDQHLKLKLKNMYRPVLLLCHMLMTCPLEINYGLRDTRLIHIYSLVWWWRARNLWSSIQTRSPCEIYLLTD